MRGNLNMREHDGMLGAHIERRLSAAEVVRAMSDLFTLPIDTFTELEAVGGAHKLPYQLFQREQGFLTSVNIYAGRDGFPSIPLTEAGFARLLSHRIQSNVAIPKPDSYSGWLILHPDGRVSEGTEGATDNNVIVIDNWQPSSLDSSTFT